MPPVVVARRLLSCCQFVVTFVLSAGRLPLVPACVLLQFQQILSLCRRVIRHLGRAECCRRVVELLLCCDRRCRCPCCWPARVVSSPVQWRYPWRLSPVAFQTGAARSRCECCRRMSDAASALAIRTRTCTASFLCARACCRALSRRVTHGRAGAERGAWSVERAHRTFLQFRIRPRQRFRNRILMFSVFLPIYWFVPSGT